MAFHTILMEVTLLSLSLSPNFKSLKTLSPNPQVLCQKVRITNNCHPFYQPLTRPCLRPTFTVPLLIFFARLVEGIILRYVLLALLYILEPFFMLKTFGLILVVLCAGPSSTWTLHLLYFGTGIGTKE